jgi:hypothetical protein
MPVRAVASDAVTATSATVVASASLRIFTARIVQRERRGSRRSA